MHFENYASQLFIFLGHGDTRNSEIRGSGDRIHLGQFKDAEPTALGCLEGRFWGLFEKCDFDDFFGFEYLEIMGIWPHFVLIFEQKSKVISVGAIYLKLPKNIYHVLEDY